MSQNLALSAETSGSGYKKKIGGGGIMQKNGRGEIVAFGAVSIHPLDISEILFMPTHRVTHTQGVS